MHILVTGGAGFIGHHLVLRLLQNGHTVSVLDSVNDYYDPTIKEARLKRFPNTVKVYRVDLADARAVAEVFDAEQFDAVCHLAAQAGVRYSLEHPDVYVRSNYVGTFTILDNMKRLGIKKLIFASTSSVYGTSEDMPFVENDLAPMPMSIYAATKRGCEHLIASYSHLYGINATCLRFFTVYGPWGRPDMALFIFTDKILKSEPITVFNNGEMRRDFTYVDDIVDGFVKALEHVNGYHIYNLGAGEPVLLMDFIKTIETTLGRTAEIDFQPLQPGDVPATAANISAAQKELGYSPHTNVSDGVPKFIEWYRSYYNA
jgi:UDP-glucuronate 4-epimerase